MNRKILIINFALLCCVNTATLFSAAQKLPINKVSNLRTKFQQLMLRTPITEKLEKEICAILEQLVFSANYLETQKTIRSELHKGVLTLTLAEWVEDAYQQLFYKLGRIPNCNLPDLQQRLALLPPVQPQPAAMPTPARPAEELELTPEEAKMIAAGGGAYRPGARVRTLPGPIRRGEELTPEEIEAIAKLQAEEEAKKRGGGGARPGVRPEIPPPPVVPPVVPPRTPEQEQRELAEFFQGPPRPEVRPAPAPVGPEPRPEEPRQIPYCPAPGCFPQEEEKKKAQEAEQLPVPEAVPPRELVRLAIPEAPAVVEAPAARPAAAIPTPEIPSPAVPPTKRVEFKQPPRKRRPAATMRITPEDQAKLGQAQRKGKAEQPVPEQVQLPAPEPVPAVQEVGEEPELAVVSGISPSYSPAGVVTGVTPGAERLSRGEIFGAGTQRAREKLHVETGTLPPSPEPTLAAPQPAVEPKTERKGILNAPKPMQERGPTGTLIAQPEQKRRAATEESEEELVISRASTLPAVATTELAAASLLPEPEFMNEPIEAGAQQTREQKYEAARARFMAEAAKPRPQESAELRKKRLISEARKSVDLIRRYELYSQNIPRFQKEGPNTVLGEFIWKKEGEKPSYEWPPKAKRSGTIKWTSRYTKNYFNALTDEARQNLDVLEKVRKEFPEIQPLAEQARLYLQQLRENVEKWRQSQGI